MFAIVELFRAVAAFMIAPIFAHFAVTAEATGSKPAPRSRSGSASGWRSGAPRIGVALYALGGARPQTPDIERFLDGDGPAWYSPPLLARVHGVTDQVEPPPAARSDT